MTKATTTRATTKEATTTRKVTTRAPTTSTTDAPDATTATATTATATTVPFWQQWEGDFDVEFSNGPVATFEINAAGLAIVASGLSTVTSQLTATTDQRCPSPGQPCALRTTAAGEQEFISLRAGAHGAAGPQITVARYTQGGTLLGTSAPGCSTSSMAAQQQQALDALEATAKAVLAQTRDLVARMKDVEVETQAMEHESRALEAALGKAGCNTDPD